jgi:hypothetical protein
LVGCGIQETRIDAAIDAHALSFLKMGAGCLKPVSQLMQQFRHHSGYYSWAQLLLF